MVQRINFSIWSIVICPPLDEIDFASEFLLSEKAGFITGIYLLIDGGTIAAINSEKMDIQIQ